MQERKMAVQKLKPQSLNTLVLALLLLICFQQLNASALDHRRHLASKTRYSLRQPFPSAPDLAATADPPGYSPIHLLLLSRHGSRFPTRDRMNQVDSLVNLFLDANNTVQHPWMAEWQSPFESEALQMAYGELHDIGEQELWSLGQRLAQRWPSLREERYLPRRYQILSSQESRTAASASAFAAGFFPEIPGSSDPCSLMQLRPKAHAQLADAGNGKGDGLNDDDDGGDCSGSSAGAVVAKLRPQAVAIHMSPLHEDPLLRFFDTCPRYVKETKRTKAWLGPWQESQWTQMLPALEQRLGMTRPLHPKEVDALWQLCVVEAGLTDTVDRACSLFDQEQVDLIEWVEDVTLYQTRGYGSPVNYRIASALLADMHATLKAVSEDDAPFQKALLMFAHEETIIPLAALLGLFQEPAQAQEHALDPAPLGSENAAEPHDGVHQVAEHRKGRLLRGAGARVGRSALAHSKHFYERAGEAFRAGTGADASVEPSVIAAQQPAAAAEALGAGELGALPPSGWTPGVPKSNNRTWHSSRLGPYGANMALVLYRANDGTDSSLPRHLVRLVYNEQVLPIPGCSRVQPASSAGSPADAARAPKTAAQDQAYQGGRPSRRLMQQQQQGEGVSQSAAPAPEAFDCDLQVFLEAYADLVAPAVMDEACGRGHRAADPLAVAAAADVV